MFCCKAVLTWLVKFVLALIGEDYAVTCSPIYFPWKGQSVFDWQGLRTSKTTGHGDRGSFGDPHLQECKPAAPIFNDFAASRVKANFPKFLKNACLVL